MWCGVLVAFAQSSSWSRVSEGPRRLPFAASMSRLLPLSWCGVVSSGISEVFRYFSPTGLYALHLPRCRGLRACEELLHLRPPPSGQDLMRQYGTNHIKCLRLLACSLIQHGVISTSSWSLILKHSFLSKAHFRIRSVRMRVHSDTTCLQAAPKVGKAGGILSSTNFERQLKSSSS